MIDGFSIQLNPKNSLLLQDMLMFHGINKIHSVYDNGEIIQWTAMTKCKSLRFIQKREYLTIRGSIHKYNDPLNNNASQFSFMEQCRTIEDLMSKFHLEGLEKLRNLEFGFNIELDTDPNLIICHCLGYKGNSPSLKKTGYIEFELQQYKLKIYDKTSDYINIMPTYYGKGIIRIEIKYKKMLPLNKIGISNLIDLTNMEKIKALYSDFKTRLNSLSILDPFVDTNLLTPHQTEQYNQCTNSIEWYNLQHSNKKKTASRRRKLLRELSAKYGTNIHNRLLIKIEETFHINLSKFNPLYPIPVIDGQPTEHTTRKCLVTGIDISDQQPSSKFIGSKKYGEKVAKRVRNSDSNLRNSVRRRIQKYDDAQTLFETKSLIKLKPEEHDSLSYWTTNGQYQNLLK